MQKLDNQFSETKLNRIFSQMMNQFDCNKRHYPHRYVTKDIASKCLLRRNTVMSWPFIAIKLCILRIVLLFGKIKKFEDHIIILIGLPILFVSCIVCKSLINLVLVIFFGSRRFEEHVWVSMDRMTNRSSSHIYSRPHWYRMRQGLFTSFSSDVDSLSQESKLAFHRNICSLESDILTTSCWTAVRSVNSAESALIVQESHEEITVTIVSKPRSLHHSSLSSSTIKQFQSVHPGSDQILIKKRQWPKAMAR